MEEREARRGEPVDGCTGGRSGRSTAELSCMKGSAKKGFMDAPDLRGDAGVSRVGRSTSKAVFDTALGVDCGKRVSEGDEGLAAERLTQLQV